jgi:hypothetical protein
MIIHILINLRFENKMIILGLGELIGSILIIFLLLSSQLTIDLLWSFIFLNACFRILKLCYKYFVNIISNLKEVII